MEYNRDLLNKDQVQLKTADVYVIDIQLNNEQIAGCSDQNCKSSSEGKRSRWESKLSLRDEKKIKASTTSHSLSLYKAPLRKKISSLRWKVCFLCFATASVSTTLRQCMSMAIFYAEWDSITEGLVLSSFFYTFPLSPLLCGYLSGRYGAKYVILVMMLLMCASSITIPLVALISPIAVMILRAFVGVGAGALMPCLNQLLSKWTPRLERSQMTSLLNSGLSIGSIITFSLSGVMCEIPVLGGWPFIFYIFSAANLLTIVVLVLCIYNSLEEHPRSNEPEIKYILQERKNNSEKMPSLPWIKLLTSGPVWAILIAHVCFTFIVTILNVLLPLYMKDVLKFDPASNGFLSSLPFIGRFLAAIVVGRLADKCIERRLMSTGLVRKMFQCISMVVSAPFLIGLSFLTEEQRALAVVLLVIYWILQSGSNSAFFVNHLDIAPVYAGVISGLTLTFASCGAIASPLMVTIVNKNNTREEWQIVFLICVGVGIFGAVAFCVLGSGELQNWAKDPKLCVGLDIDQESKSKKGFEPKENTISNAE